MAHTDPVAMFLTSIRNALCARKEKVNAHASNLNMQVAEILKAEKFIKDFKVVEEDNGKRSIRVHLRYFKNGKPAIRSIRRVSKPGLRKYASAESVPKVLNGLGVAILSTSEGVVTDKTARENHVGGEILCTVY